MASISVPCPKTSLVAPNGSNAPNPHPTSTISFPLPSSTLLGFQWPNKKQSLTKVQAQVKEVILGKSSNSAPVLDSNSKVPSSEEEDQSTGNNVPDASSISAFMTQVSELVKLVDSRDIIELQLKQLGCELIIRKKEALQQPPPATPVITMQPPRQYAMLPSPTPAAPAVAPPRSTPAAPAHALTPAKTSSSSHPQLKCPMAGTFYQCPAPGEPPFVKVGDKVQKGQVICIIEAMKLMNEIEADQSGTITAILVEDGKPVSVDTPLFVIVP